MSAEPNQDAAGAETELKFDVTVDALRRLIRRPALGGAVETETLRAIYFDTSGLDLRKAGLSLRVRKEGTGFVQTVKRVRGSEVFARDEWEANITGAGLDAAALAATPVAKLLKKDYAALAPIFTSTVTRITRLVIDGADVIAVTIDKGRLAAGSLRAPVLEMELELKTGEPKALFKLARELFEASPIRLSLLTKSDRGFALAGVERARAGKTSPTPLSPEMSIAEAFRRIARSCLVQVVSSAEILQREPSAEGVHQTRIGLRRLRTAMRIFKPAVDDARCDWIEQEVRWIAGELGDARTLDVFLEDSFQPAAPMLGDEKLAARYGAQLASARMAAYDKALAAVASPRFAKLTLEVAIWIDSGDWRSSPVAERGALLASPIGPFAAHALGQLRKTVRARGEGLARLDTDHRHKLRIRAKRLRYATQFFELAFGEPHPKRRRRFTEALKALQDSLGRLNDIAGVETAAIQALDGRRTPALAFAAGEIVGRIKVTETATVDKAIEAYEDFTEAKRFWPRDKPTPEKGV